MITDESWKAAAHDLSDSLETFKEPFKADFKEIIIVPDGVTWYVPFEALPFGDAKENRPLISRLRIRYAPMMALALPLHDGRKTSPTFGVVVGKLYPSDTPEIGEAAVWSKFNMWLRTQCRCRHRWRRLRPWSVR